jgi:ParB/RepB/Spo0J family partition protein
MGGSPTIVKLANIRENPEALRAVDKASEEYIGLVDSIRQKGVLNAISVRELPTGPDGSKQVSKDGETLYALIDGLHRFHSAIDAGLTEIPALVFDFNQAEMLEAQIEANVHKKETKHIEYVRGIQRLMALNPTRTVNDQASRLGKNLTWLKDRLGLLKLTEKCQELVDTGKVVISNAFALSKLPPEEQADWVDRAMTQSPAEFCKAANDRSKEIRDARKKGKDAAPVSFQATAHARKFGEVNEEYQRQTIGKKIIAQKNITSPFDAWRAAIEWCVSMDAETRSTKEAEHNARQAAKADLAATRKVEREAKKKQEATEAAVGAGAS